jgi:RNA polymerase sigma factor (sigma-70 family)
MDEPLTQLLAQRAQSGDLARFEELCQRTLPALHAWVSMRLGAALCGRVDPDDIVNESWVRALQRFESYDSARSAFRTWLFGFAKNVLRERLRELAGQVAPPTSMQSQLPDEVTSLTRQLARRDAVATFLARVEALGAEERELVALFGLEGLAAEDVALRLGISADAAQKRWQRLRAALAEREFPREILSGA